MILGSSGSLRPPSRTEPYIMIRDTTILLISERGLRCVSQQDTWGGMLGLTQRR